MRGARLDAEPASAVEPELGHDQRGLESVRERSDVALGSAVDDAEPSDAERERVRGVLDEWSDLETYLPRVNAPGSRIGSYREESPSGVTLVAFIGTSELRELFALLQAAVDALLPGRYAWLDDASLHCTVRALVEGRNYVTTNQFYTKRS